MTRFKVWRLLCLGNEKDGFEVNDRVHVANITVPEEDMINEIGKVLSLDLKTFTVDDSNEEFIDIDFPNGKPALRLEKEDIADDSI